MLPRDLSVTTMARVLIIDDDFEVLDVLRDVVSDIGHEVEAAATGLGGLTQVELFRPDVVLLDLAMPAPSGYEVLTTLRRDHPRLPVIMVAAGVDVAISERLLARGAFAYVEKPFTIEGLRTVINAALGQRATGG